VPKAPHIPTSGGRFLTARWSTLLLSIGAVAAVGLAACGSTSASSTGPTTTTYAPAQYGASPTHPSPAEQAATLSATAGYRRLLLTTAETYAADVQRLATDATAGNLSAARTDELEAQSAYDVLRASIQPDSATADEIDGEAWSTGSSPFVGLHAIERSLWDGPSASGITKDAAQLAASSATIAFLFYRAVLTPQQITAQAQGTLSWVVNVPIQQREELYSHDDMLDVTASIDAANRAFELVAPLGRIVDSATTALVASRFAVVESALASLGNAPARLDDTMSTAQWRALAVDVDAVNAPLGTLTGDLAGFGSGRLYA
jgi:hypothetical protein